MGNINAGIGGSMTMQQGGYSIEIEGVHMTDQNNGNWEGHGGNAGEKDTSSRDENQHQNLIIFNGQMGYWNSEVISGGRNDRTVSRFVAVGPSEVSKAAAIYQANFNSMLERARQLALSQAVGASNTEQLRQDFIRDRAAFRPTDLGAINAELDRATITARNTIALSYQANFNSMLSVLAC